MKVLYISHSKEQSGYGRYCREFLKALKTTNLEISSLAIPLGKVMDTIDETEKVSLSSPDIVVQNILPHFMSKGPVKSVGTAILETKDVKYNYWYEHLDMLDQVIYPHNNLNLFKNEVEIPTAIDLNKPKIPKLNIEEANGTYKFYWIGELSKRKNLFGLIKAYYQTFNYSEPVSLIIKAHSSQFDSKKAKKQVLELIHTISNGMKMYEDPKNYPRIIVLTDFFDDEQILALHEYADCFLSSSHGESINYPMLDAMYYNNNIISTTTFATEFYMNYGNIELVASDGLEPCFGQVETFNWYQSSLESWPTFNHKQFCDKMRKVYENRSKQNNNLSGLDYSTVGKIIKEKLL